MSNHDETYAWQLADLREEIGTTVTFRGEDFRVIAEEVSGAVVGMNGLPSATRESIGVSIAELDPHKFVFSASEFDPYYDRTPPKPLEQLIWHGLIFVITNVTYHDVGHDTTSGVVCFALKKWWQ